MARDSAPCPKKDMEVSTNIKVHMRLDLHLPTTIFIPQVFNRLQRLQLCISHAALLKTLNEAAEGHDERVCDWQDTLQEYASNQASANILIANTQLCVLIICIM